MKQLIISSLFAASALALLVTFSFACLTQAFVANDFSVVYVAQHSNSLLPIEYRVAGVWGGTSGAKVMGYFPTSLFMILVGVTFLFGMAQLAEAADESARTAANYQRHCASCHGADRLGGIGPALIPENLARLRKPEAEMVIREGRPATQMLGFSQQLNSEEIRRNFNK